MDNSTYLFGKFCHIFIWQGKHFRNPKSPPLMKLKFIDSFSSGIVAIFLICLVKFNTLNFEIKIRILF